MGMYGWSGYTAKSYREQIESAIKDIQTLRDKHKFDALAFCGSSGGSIAFPACLALGIPLIMVRKEGEKSHGEYVECHEHARIKSFLIVDDFIDSGETIRFILEKAIQYSECDIEQQLHWSCVGAYQWDSSNAVYEDARVFTIKVPHMRRKQKYGLPLWAPNSVI